MLMEIDQRVPVSTANNPNTVAGSFSISVP